MDINSFGSAIIGAIVGGILTGVFSLIATKQAYNYQKSQTKHNDSILINSLLQSINDEIETVFEQYQNTIGNSIEDLKEDEPLLFFYPIHSDYFPIYNNNCNLIGRIPNHTLRKQIIHTYTLAKSITDSFRLNNELVSKFESAKKLYEQTLVQAHQLQAYAHQKVLINYAKVLKDSHNNLIKEVNNCLILLKNSVNKK